MAEGAAKGILHIVFETGEILKNSETIEIDHS